MRNVEWGRLLLYITLVSLQLVVLVFTMHYPFSFEPPIPSPIYIFPFNTNHSIYSLRATADASTPSTSSIATPVQDRFVVQSTPITADESCQNFSSYSGQAVHPSDPLDCFPLASKPCLNGEGAISTSPSALLNPHRVMCKLGCFVPPGT